MEIYGELQTLLQTHGNLPEDELKALSGRLRIPCHRLQALASFYPHLGHPEAGRIRVCRDLSCRLAGAEALADDLERRFPGQVETCSCLGRCDRGPAAVAEGRGLAGLAPGDSLEPILAAPGPLPPGFSLDPYAGPGERYGVLREALAGGDRDGVVRALEASGLKGLGGAGFPTGLKWKLVRQAEGRLKHVVVNGDESEPGTFKDRFVLRHAPHLVVEGALLGAWVVGAQEATLFVRHEYGEEIEVLRACVADARPLAEAAGCRLEVAVSPGGYICGEETALLEALSQRRAEPRNKPPFPGTHGLHGRPTLINNVETLAWIPAILRRGEAWWKAAAPKLVGLSGHVARPGVYEVRLGTPVRDLIAAAGGLTGGRDLKAFSPGGASSGFLSADLADLPYDFKPLAEAGSMLGSGALVVLGSGTCLVDAALSSARFFRDESCGKCVPCRAGTAQLAGLLERLSTFRAREEELEPAQELAAAMADASICGLGQAAPLPLLSLLRHFGDELRAHLAGHCPEGVCRP